MGGAVYDYLGVTVNFLLIALASLTMVFWQVRDKLETGRSGQAQGWCEQWALIRDRTLRAVFLCRAS